LITSTVFVLNPHLRKVNYHPLSSFEPVCQLTSAPVVIGVNGASPQRTLGDLVNSARANPGNLTMAGLPASPAQIGFEMLKRAANVELTFVPFPGDAPAINALLGEHVTSILAPYPAMAEQIKAGKLRALATASPARVEPLPDVPTMVESGYQGFEIDFWSGLFAPAKTPKEIVSRLEAWFSAAVRAPEIKPKLAAQGLLPVGLCGTDFGALLRKQYEENGRIIREANIKAE
jgi:tripartite-type tricarboxylate transporter receptor subunit TctC